MLAETISTDRVHGKGLSWWGIKMQRKLKAVSIVVIAVLFIGCSWYAPIQKMAADQIDVGLNRALATFATARLLNAGISLVKGTQLDLQPGGMGLTLSIGQVLDPVDELVEQFSTIMLIACAAFGIQKILLLIGGAKSLSIAVSVAVGIWAALSLIGKSHQAVSRITVLLIVVRFAVPVATLSTDLIYRSVMATEYAEAQQQIGAATRSVNPASTAPVVVDKSVFERMKDKLVFAIDSHKPDIEGIRKAVEGLPKHIVTLVAGFVMQTILLPIGFVWLLVTAARAIVRRPHVFVGSPLG